MIEKSTILSRKKVLIVDSFADNNANLESWFSNRHEFEVIGIFQSPQAVISASAIMAPDLAIIGIDIPNGTHFCKMLRKQNPSVLIIGLVSQHDANVEVSLRQAGAVRTMLRGVNTAQIDMAILSVLSADDSALCSIIGVGGIKEGLGTTLLTAAIGDFLARKFPGRILFLDLDFLRGDLAFSLGISSQKSIQDLLARDDFLEFGPLQNYITGTGRGFSIIPTAQDRQIKYISDIAIVSLITILGNLFEIILIDLPIYPFQGLSGVTDICDRIILNTGETPNQLKSLVQAVSSDFKTMPDYLLEKLLFVSWCREAEMKNEIARQVPGCVFLPRPEQALFSDPAFTITLTDEFKQLRNALKSLLGKIPSLPLPQTNDEEDSDPGLLARFSNYISGN
ncbi:MAG: response regulator [Candidatus Riflebacteria bacterium]|nr:response regulator [Candidatus Riflebacteria bacterium]